MGKVEHEHSKNILQMKPWIKPGYLSQVMRADERRMEFDCKNQTLIQKRM